MHLEWYYVGRLFDIQSNHVRFGHIQSILVFPTLARPHSIIFFYVQILDYYYNITLAYDKNYLIKVLEGKNL